MSVTEVHGALGLDKLKNRTFQIFKVGLKILLLWISAQNKFRKFKLHSHLRPVLRKEKAWMRVWNGWATRCRTRNRNLWLWSCPELESLSILIMSKIFSYFSDCDYNFHVYKFYIGVRKERNCFVFHSPCPPSSCTPPVCCVSSCFGFGDSTEVKTYFRSSKKPKKQLLS